MDKTAALHRCELCGETVGEEMLGGYVDDKGPYCIYCMDPAIQEARKDEGIPEMNNCDKAPDAICVYCCKPITRAEAEAWLADIDVGGALCNHCFSEFIELTPQERKEAIDVIRKEKKELAQDNMRYTWSSNSRA